MARPTPAARDARPAPRGLETAIGSSGIPGATVLRRVGPRLGLHAVRDLMVHLPRRYDDLREVLPVARLRELPDGAIATARLEVLSLRVQQTFRRRVQRTTAILRDDTGEAEATWFGRRFIERRLREGDRVVVSGRVKQRGFVVLFDDPEFQRDDGSALLHAGRIVPVYRLTAGLTARTLRGAIRAALDRYGPYPEYLPDGARVEGLAGIGEAVEQAHFPAEFGRKDRALDRLAFDELLALQVGMVSRKRQRRRQTGEPIEVEEGRLSAAAALVEGVIDGSVQRRMAAARADAPPVTGPPAAIRLTDDQLAAVRAIASDLADDRPMLRLLQGDVGSGKTAVAALAMAFVADARRQAALLAPTDLLARQHAATLTDLLEPLGHRVSLLSASMPAGRRREALELLGAPLDSATDGLTLGRIVVGTHALVQDAVSFADLRLAVVDEQHRFGVAEREALAAKGTAPHVLLMSATPIPRTLGQILHADLDVSDLRAAPRGRQLVDTAVRRPDELVRRHDGRTGVIPHIAREVAAAHRAFVIVPLVDDPEEGGGTSVEAGAALIHDAWQEAVELAGAPGTPLALEIVHGQMRAAERDERMERFRRGETTVLVGTTVLEVGVDVPEATVMLILDADRFGIAQLHQLRGRVGRGESRSGCVLVSELYPPEGVPESRMTDEQRLVKARLEALVEHHDGFRLAELDFELRREGELLGLQQSGLPPLRVASLTSARHRELSREARVRAEGLVDDDGRLRPGHEALERELTVGWLRRVGAGEVLAADELDA